MLADLRAIWSEDCYQLLGPGDSPEKFYFGRQKGDVYQVFLRSAYSARRLLVEERVLIEEQNLFWCSKANRLVLEDVLSSDVEKTENILQGYLYNRIRSTKVSDLSEVVDVHRKVLSRGAEAVVLYPKNSDQWVLSIHGGPESREDLEMRYGGLYRDLLRQKIGIVILNYRGSLGDMTEGAQTWGRWKSSFLEDFQDLIADSVFGVGKLPSASFGVSFGGALALLLAQAFPIGTTILSSPLLDLSHQRQRAEVDKTSDWFHKRFSDQDFKDFSFSCLTGKSNSSIHAFYDPTDEVLGSTVFSRLESLNLGWNLYPDSGGHAPRRYQDIRNRFVKVLAAFPKSEST